MKNVTRTDGVDAEYELKRLVALRDQLTTELAGLPPEVITGLTASIDELTGRLGGRVRGLTQHGEKPDDLAAHFRLILGMNNQVDALMRAGVDQKTAWKAAAITRRADGRVRPTYPEVARRVRRFVSYVAARSTRPSAVRIDARSRSPRRHARRLYSAARRRDGPPEPPEPPGGSSRQGRDIATSSGCAGAEVHS